VFREAASYLSDFGGTFHELVAQNVAEIQVIDGLNETCDWLNFQYATPLPVVLRRNTFYLACRLVWCAAYFKALRPVPWWRRLVLLRSARVAGRNAWLSFVKLFPDADPWLEYLRGHGA